MIKNSKVDALARMFRNRVSDEEVIEWYKRSGSMYSNTAIKNTLKIANKEYLRDSMIEEEDIDLGDKVKSRMTGREGEVVKIHTDGDTITVKWNTGGLQPLSKESVYKLSGEFNPEKKNYNKVHTDIDGYNGMDGESADFTKVHVKND